MKKFLVSSLVVASVLAVGSSAFAIHQPVTVPPIFIDGHGICNAEDNPTARQANAISTDPYGDLCFVDPPPPTP